MASVLNPLPNPELPPTLAGRRPADPALRLARAAARSLQAAAALVSRCDGGEHLLWRSFGLPGDPRPGEPLPLAAAVCARAAAAARPVAERAARDDLSLRRDLSAPGFEAASFVAAPLRSTAGLVLGVLVVLDPEPRAWDADEVDAAEDLAAGLAAALERERAEAEAELLAAALWRSENRNRRLNEAAVGGVFAVDGRGCFTEVNSGLAVILDRPAGELIGARFADLVAVEDLEAAAAARRRCVEGGCAREQVELRVVRPSGERRLLTVSLVAAEPGTPAAGAYGLAADITEQRTREAEFRRAERMASVGPMLSGVCHELNNPLTSIKSFAELMLLDDRPPEDREALEIVQREAHRAAKIVSDLRVVARQTQEAGTGRGMVPLGEVVQEVLVRREAAIRAQGVTVHREIPADLPAAWAVRAQVEQILLQLLTNAEYAVAEADGHREIFVRAYRTETGVALQVEDTGPGIPEADRERIFDPFWTTRKAGEGTGLGLSLVQSIVADHGGRIQVDSTPGRGARLTVELPAAEQPPVVLGTPELGGATNRPLRLLVVDDEAAIRFSLARYMERRGHTVVQAAEGGAALRLLDEARGGADLDIILADLRMPGLDGEQLLARLRARDPRLEQRLIFITGDAESPDAERVLEAAGVPVVLKPFELAEIAQIIEAHAGLEHAPLT